MSAALKILARPVLTDGVAEFLSSRKLEWRETETATVPERLVEFAGRICYMSFGAAQFRTSNRDYIANLIAQGHGSVLEHVNWTFLLTGVTRAFTHQLVRHRVGFSFSQLSQQYHDESDAQFIMPKGIEQSSTAVTAWHDAMEKIRLAYETIKGEFPVNVGLSSLREKNRAVRSAARGVLPNATMTTIVVTANARALRHFLAVRGNIEGDDEMREVSSLIYEMLRDEAPNLIADFVLGQMDDGTPKVMLKRDCRDISEIANPAA